MTRINSDEKVPSIDDEIDKALKKDESGVSQWTTGWSLESPPTLGGPVKAERSQ